MMWPCDRSPTVRIGFRHGGDPLSRLVRVARRSLVVRGHPRPRGRRRVDGGKALPAGAGTRPSCLGHRLWNRRRRGGVRSLPQSQTPKGCSCQFATTGSPADAGRRRWATIWERYVRRPSRNGHHQRGERSPSGAAEKPMTDTLTPEVQQEVGTAARLKFAVLCDYASFTNDDKLNLLGIFTSLKPRQFPFPISQFFVVAVHELPATSAPQQFKIGLSVRDPEGGALFTLDEVAQAITRSEI